MDFSALWDAQNTATSLFHTRLRTLYNQRLRLARASLIAELDSFRVGLEESSNVFIDTVSEALPPITLRSNTATSTTTQDSENVSTSYPTVRFQNDLTVPSGVSTASNDGVGNKQCEASSSAKKVLQLVSNLKSSIFLFPDGNDALHAAKLRKCPVLYSRVLPSFGGHQLNINCQSCTGERLKDEPFCAQNTCSNLKSDMIDCTLSSSNEETNEELYVRLFASSVSASQHALVAQVYFSHEFRSLRFSNDMTISFVGRSEKDLVTYVEYLVGLVTSSTETSSSFDCNLPPSEKKDLRFLHKYERQLLPQCAEEIERKGSWSVMPIRMKTAPKISLETLRSLQSVTQRGHSKCTTEQFYRSISLDTQTLQSIDVTSWPTGVSLYTNGYAAYASAVQRERVAAYSIPTSQILAHYPYRCRSIQSSEDETCDGARPKVCGNSEMRPFEARLFMNTNSSHSSFRSSDRPTELQSKLISTNSSDENVTPQFQSNTASFTFFDSALEHPIFALENVETSQHLNVYEIDCEGNLQSQ